MNRTARRATMTDGSCVSETNQTSTNSSIPEQRVATSFSVANLTEIIAGFSVEKKELVKSIGFGMLLKLLPLNKFPRQLAFWVMRNIDKNTEELEVNKGVKIKMTEHDVELVLAIPRKSKIVKCALQASEMELSKLRNILC